MSVARDMYMHARIHACVQACTCTMPQTHLCTQEVFEGRMHRLEHSVRGSSVTVSRVKQELEHKVLDADPQLQLQQ